MTSTFFFIVLNWTGFLETLADSQKLKGNEWGIAIREGIITKKMIEITNMEAICYRYKMSPKEYMEQDPKYILAFKAIIQGKMESNTIEGLE